MILKISKPITRFCSLRYLFTTSWQVGKCIYEHCIVNTDHKIETLDSTWPYNSSKSVSHINNSKVSLYAYIHNLSLGEGIYNPDILGLHWIKPYLRQNVIQPSHVHTQILFKEKPFETVVRQLWVHNPCVRVRLLSPWYVLMLRCKIL